MSGLSSSADAFISKWSQEILSALRIVAAFMFMQHGAQKMFGFPVASNREFELISLNPGLIGVLEVFGGALLLVGLFTRPVAFVLSGSMAFAYFMAHFPRDFWTVANGGDAAVLYCFVFLYMAAVGGGKWSLDNVWRRGGI
jgi:putative oxidoreductase